jgi:hypothetical protein
MSDFQREGRSAWYLSSVTGPYMPGGVESIRQCYTLLVSLFFFPVR